MSKDKKCSIPGRPSRPCWVFDPSIPVSEWFEGQSLDDMVQLQDAVETFVYEMEQGRFLSWEAVCCKEQNLPLTSPQEEALGSLISFDTIFDEDNPIFYIDGIERPSKPWDEILNQIVSHLLLEPFDTSAAMWDVTAEGFPKLMEAVRKYGQGLSLPPGVNFPEEVVADELRHKMWLQLCFDDLAGLGQEPELNLTEQPERIEWFVDHLREHKNSVRFLGLSLETLMKRIVLPEADLPIFTELMQEQLSLSSLQEPIASHL